MKRITSAILAVLMLLSILSSCAQGDDAVTDPSTSAPDTSTAPDTETTPETESVPTDNLPETDMDGFELNLYHDNGESITWALCTLEAEDYTGDTLNDAIYDRNSYIENRFDCTLNYTAVKRVRDTIAGIVTSGDPTYDVIMQYGAYIMSCIQYDADISVLPYIQHETEYWNPDAAAIYHIGDKRIALVGNFSLSSLSTALTLAFNKNIMEDLQIGVNLYDLVREGSWTYDKFLEIGNSAVRDLNGDGVMSLQDDLYAFTDTIRGAHHSLTLGGGYRVVQKDENNMPYFALPTDENMVNYWVKMIETELANPYFLANSYQYDIHSTDGLTDFNTGHALFKGVSLNTVASMREMEDDFGLLPFPKENEDQKRYYTATGTGEMLTLPLSADPSHFEYVGMLMEAMSFYSHYNLLPVYKDTLLKSRYARDEDTGEMLDIIFTTLTFDQGMSLFTSSFYKTLITGTFQARNVNVASLIAKMKPSVEAEIAAFVKKLEAMP